MHWEFIQKITFWPIPEKPIALAEQIKVTYVTKHEYFVCNYTVFHKKTVPFVISLYLYFYKDEFHENPPEYTRDIGHYEHKINIRDSLTILCHRHYNEGTPKCQENKHKTRYI